MYNKIKYIKFFSSKNGIQVSLCFAYGKNFHRIIDSEFNRTGSAFAGLAGILWMTPHEMLRGSLLLLKVLISQQDSCNCLKVIFSLN